MDLYARVNILEGKAVRLPRGNVDDAIFLDADPIARAQGWITKGIDRLLIVDLDAAARDDDRNRPLLADLIEAVEVPVIVAGGVRSAAEVDKLLAAGAWRVGMGTIAIIDQVLFWELCRAHPGRIMVSLDVRPDEELAIRGWTEGSGHYLEEVLIELSSAGAAGFMISEVGRDALVEPPNYDALRLALSLVDEEVVAAGGVRNLDDIEALCALQVDGKRLAGVVVGREVTAGRFTVAEANAILQAERPRRPWTAKELEVAVADYQTVRPDDAAAARRFVDWLLHRG